MKNHIIILGNGFDLAHNVKTSFSDFANYYLENVIVPRLFICIKEKEENDPIIRENFLLNLFKNINTLSNKGNLIKIKNLLVFNDKDGLLEYFRSSPKNLSDVLKNYFLANLYANDYDLWFNIEEAYFYELNRLKKEAVSQKMKFDENKVTLLNQCLIEIKKELIKYLKTIEILPNSEIDKFFATNFDVDDNIYIINFNYTNTIVHYLREPNKDLSAVNFIHGSLESNNIVFGYGNDTNLDYKEIKNLGRNCFLEHFKTFYYLDNSNYDRIFIEAVNEFEEYSVSVIGHSLGLTDKTLLSEIMDNDKCKEIRFFKRGDKIGNQKEVKKAYNQLKYAASRILKNDNDLRKKVVNYEKGIYFP